MTWELTVLMTAKLLGFVFFISALEYFALPHLARRLSSIPGWSHLLSAIVLWFFPGTWLIWLPLIAVVISTWFFTRRFNGGSDSVMFWMSFLVALVYTTAETKIYFPVLVVMAMGFLGVFAYFIAGASKLLSKPWRTGEAFEWSLSQSCFMKSFNGLKSQSRPIAIAVMVWQLSFPLALTHRYLAVFYIVTGLLFHLINARVMGLNRFTFAFACFYPAIFFLAPLRI